MDNLQHMVADEDDDDDDDARRLRALGYKQSLKRDLNVLQNIACSFSVISVMTGITGTLGSTGLVYGGPVSIVYGWLLVSVFSLLVGLAMAEICSSMPTSGGLYFWSYHLAGPQHGPLACWMTGWFNLLGQVAVTAGVAFTLANMTAAMILIATGGTTGGGHVCGAPELLAIYGAYLVVQGAINIFSVKLLWRLQYVSVAWNSVGLLLVVVALPLLATKHQSAEWVFTHFETDNAAAAGIQDPTYIFLLGLLLSQYTIEGFDASAHMVEETRDASMSGPIGIVVSIAVSAVLGLVYILALLFSISDPAWVVNPANDAGGYAAAQIYLDAVRGRTGSTAGGLALLVVPLGAMFWCGLSCVTGNSRMLYAFSRDGAVPYSHIWHQVDPKTHVPNNAVIGMCCAAFVIGLPLLYDLQAFNAIISLSAIGLFISYALPIFLRSTLGRHTFQPGPFHLGVWSPFVGALAVTWTAFITVLFCLPTVWPVSIENFNYAPVAMLLVLAFSGGWWVLGARKWFTGPVSNLSDEEISEILHQPLVSAP